MSAARKHRLLGVELTPLTMDQLHRVIADTVATGRRSIIANHNLHSIYLYHRDARMRACYQKAEYAHIDGMALVLIGRALGHQLAREQRVTYVDWVRPLMAEAVANRWRIFYLGSKPGVAEKAAGLLADEFPGLCIATHDGYFDTDPAKEQNTWVLSTIAVFRPHILMVGMGMPRQERWISENLERIEANVILPAGACFDYVAGVVPTPPRWMGRMGVEWLYRLLSEPGRLWRRYLCEPLYLIPLVLKELLRRGSAEA